MGTDPEVARRLKTSVDNQHVIIAWRRRWPLRRQNQFDATFQQRLHRLTIIFLLTIYTSPSLNTFTDFSSLSPVLKTRRNILTAPQSQSLLLCTSLRLYLQKGKYHATTAVCVLLSGPLLIVIVCLVPSVQRPSCLLLCFRDCLSFCWCVHGFQTKT